MIPRWITERPLRSKLFAATLGLVVASALATILIIGPVVRNRFREEISKRGQSIATHMARESVSPLLTEDRIGLRLRMSDILRQERDLVYVYIHDRGGAVIAHTFEGGFPADLRRPGQESTSDGMERLDTGRGMVEDFAAPILEGSLGTVHVGVSEEPVVRALNELWSSLLPMYAMILLATGAVAAIISEATARPISRLAEVADAVGKGNLDLRVPAGMGGEVGRLSQAFNRMVEDLSLDIARREETEKALLEARDRLESQNSELRKLDRVKDGLVRDVSHELKTPVAKQAMQLEILRLALERDDGKAEIQRAIQSMRENISRQEKVIRSILDLSRLEAGGRRFDPKPVRLDQVVSSVLEEYRTMVEAHGGEFSADLEEISLTSDGEMLWHLFSNLVNNAVKYRSPKRPLRIAVSATARGGEAVVRLRDNGIGMSPEELEQAFHRFYQSSPSMDGAGVGLPICRLIATGLGGSVRLESGGKDAGCSAVVALPLLLVARSSAA